MTKQQLSGPIVPSNRYGEGLDTKLHAKLEAAANKLLAASGYFTEDQEEAIMDYFEDLFGEAEYIPLDADACSTYGLRPTWHGRA